MAHMMNPQGKGSGFRFGLSGFGLVTIVDSKIPAWP